QKKKQQKHLKYLQHNYIFILGGGRRPGRAGGPPLTTSQSSALDDEYGGWVRINKVDIRK
ncbi:MAG: hypothetical protein AB8Y67_03745, partial [Coxiella-like endosymbiont]